MVQSFKLAKQRFLIKEGEPFGVFFGNQVLRDLADLPSSADRRNMGNSDGIVIDQNHVPQFLLDENGNDAGSHWWH